jgi:hypothetical protein
VDDNEYRRNYVPGWPGPAVFVALVVLVLLIFLVIALATFDPPVD